MATWIVHLRLAEKLYHHFSDLTLDKQAFYLGNIAIDSGKTDGITTIPPKYITHWFVSEHNPTCRYEDFFHTFLMEQMDCFSYSFYLGCVAHLITDDLWIKNIVFKTKQQYAKELKEDSKFMLKPKQDWYDLDFLFLQNHPHFKPLDVLSRIQHFENTYLSWFDKDAIQHKLNELLAFYQNIPNHLDHEYIYLSEEEMNQFIDSSNTVIRKELERLLNKISL